VIKSKRTPTLVPKKRQHLGIYEDPIQDQENRPPVSPQTREQLVDKFLPRISKDSKHRSLALHLIDRLQAVAHHTPAEIAHLRLFTDFTKQIRQNYFIPQFVVDTFCGFTQKASERAILTVLTTDNVAAGLPDPRDCPRLLTDAETQRMDNAFWWDG
jgi:hypothetical protein